VSATKRNGRRQPDNFGAQPRSSGPPSYAFQNNARKPQDDIASETEELRKKEKDLDSDEEKDKVDRKTFKDGPDGQKAPKKDKSSAQPAPVNTLKSSFAKCWTIVDHINVPLIQYDTKSFYHPNAISIFEVLHQMENILSDNERLKWTSPNYFSLPVRIYYAVIFHVQVLRARQESGTITKSQSSWLRAFFRVYKDTSCPIAGPLVPIFSNIVSCLPDDDQFDYVYPNLPNEGTYSIQVPVAPATTTDLTVHGNHQLIPSVPMLIELFKKSTTTLLTGGTTKSSKDEYIPFKISTGGTFAGAVLPAHVDGAANAQTTRFLTNPAIINPIPETHSRLKEIRSYWKRSVLTSAPDVEVTARTATVPGSFSTTGIAQMVCMTEDFDWFRPCVDMANIQSRFFDDSVNLSAIPTVGGISSLVTSTLKFNGHVTIPAFTDEWFPQTYSKASATFVATANELTLDSTYAAAYALTNSELEWINTDGHKIGSLASGSKGGEYFANAKKTYELDADVRVMTGIYTMLQSQFYDADGQC